MKTGSKQRKFENFILICWGSLFWGDFGRRAGTIIFGTLLSVTLRHVTSRYDMSHYYTLRYVTIRYDTFTLLDVTAHCTTVVFNVFSFVFTVENKKQREQDRTSHECQYSEKPSSVVYWSCFISQPSWMKKYICFDSARRKSQNKNFVLRFVVSIMGLWKWLNYYNTVKILKWRLMFETLGRMVHWIKLKWTTYKDKMAVRLKMSSFINMLK